MKTIDRLVFWLFRKQIKGFAKNVICRAFSDHGYINSRQLHQVAALIDKTNL